MEVRTPDRHLTSERDSEEEGVSKHHRHREEDGTSEKHRNSEGKSSRHKHKHHKHKHRKKHRKGHADASTEEVGSDRGERGSVDRTQRDLIPLAGDIELADAQMIKNDFMVTEEECMGNGREVDKLDETHQRLEHVEVRLTGIASRHGMDDEMEEGEILDEEEVNHKVASSDVESGEIEGVSNSQLRESRHLYSAEISNLKSGRSSSNHKVSSLLAFNHLSYCIFCNSQVSKHIVN